MKFLSLLLAFFCLFPLSLYSQTKVYYTLSFEKRAYHEVDVCAEFFGLDTAKDFTSFVMAATSPGRYAVHNFAKNVFAIKAEDAEKKSLALQRVSPNEWKVPVKASYIKLYYKVYGEFSDGTYMGVDTNCFTLNAPALYLWTREMLGVKELPIHVCLKKPDNSNWSFASQLPLVQDNIYKAQNLDYLLDSPIIGGKLGFSSWTVLGQTIKIALNFLGSLQANTAFVDKVKRIVEEEVAIFGELPSFDFGEYSFLLSYLPSMRRDGMEHRNSTLITHLQSNNNLGNYHLPTIAHEFFHCWNVERLRPQSIQPFNYEKAMCCGELWFSEGVTSYYTDLVLLRAGVIDVDAYLRQQEEMINEFLLSTGRLVNSAFEMSQMAPFADQACHADVFNEGNTYVSYYLHGALLGLYLDLELRAKYPGKSLDAFMRQLWSKFGKIEKPFTSKDLQMELALLTADEAFASSFFNEYIYGKKNIDFEAAFLKMGIAVKSKKNLRSWLGLMAYEGSTIAAVPAYGSPLYEANLQKGDEILELAGKKVSSELEIEAALSKLPPQAKVKVSFLRNGQKMSGTVSLEKYPLISLSLLPNASQEQLALRKAWMSSLLK